MISKKIKSIIQSFAHSFGYHVLSKGCISGDMTLFLRGLKSRGFNPSVIYDVGANNGDWSRQCRDIFSQSRYYLFEPQQEFEEELSSFFTNSKGAYFIAGAGPVNSEMTLTVWEDHAGSSFIPGNNNNDGKTLRKVPVYAIDSLISEGKAEVPNLCKLDVQGFELEVLKGAEGIIGKTEVFILETSMFRFFENQPVAHEIILFMAEKGYEIYDFAGFANRPVDGALGQVDICFVHKNCMLKKNLSWN